MCFFCKDNKTVPSKTTHVATYDNTIIIVRNVPCLECEQCGEKYYSDEVLEKLEQIINNARALASEILIMDYDKKVA